MNTHRRTRRLVPWLVCAAIVPAAVSAAERQCDPSFENCRTELVALIDNENVGLDVAFWFMEDQRYVSHIVARWKAGVPVRIIVDPRANSTYPLNATSLDTLGTAGIPMRKKRSGGLMHWKTMIFAGQNVVEFGSANSARTRSCPRRPTRITLARRSSTPTIPRSSEASSGNSTMSGWTRPRTRTMRT